MKRVKQGLNPGLTCGGVLQTMVDSRANLDAQIRELLISKFGSDLVFDTAISTAVAHRQTTVEGMSIFELAPTSKAAEQYQAFTVEAVERLALREFIHPERIVELVPQPAAASSAPAPSPAPQRTPDSAPTVGEVTNG